jgi:hypothetical protein
MSGVEPNKLNEFDTILRSSKDFKSLQYLSDQARRIIKVIELNLNTMKCFQQELDSLVSLSLSNLAVLSSINALSGTLRKIQQEQGFSLSSASAVLGRAKATVEQVRCRLSHK